MPALGLLPGAVLKSIGGMPQLPLKNLYSERAVTEPTGFVLLSRPELGALPFTNGTGPIRGLFSAEGVLSGTYVSISAGDFYANGANKGAISVYEISPPSIAGNEIGIVAAGGFDAVFYNGSTLQTITFPDGAGVTKVLEQGGRFIFLRADSQRYYWTKPYSAMIVGGNIEVDPLAFASAESEPDLLKDAVVYKGFLVLGGSSTIELHAYIGDENLPWIPQVGSVINKGVLATGCMTVWNRTFVWISPDRVVYQYDGNGADPISTPGVEEILYLEALSNEVYIDTFNYLGKEFLRVKGPSSGDLLFDPQTGEWHQWDTANGPFLGGPVATFPSNPEAAIFGSMVDGKFYALLGGNAEGGIDRIFRVGIPVDGGQFTMNNLILRCQVGQSDTATIEMRYSRDRGKNWSAWLPGSLGDAGDYRTKVEWRALGLVDQPGFLAEFKVNAAEFSVSGALFNESMAGRSRG